ncbi:MAG: FAD-dependent oxidoreductase [Candidatus Omnitrophica bacterium]|nr:FAD-dependent oxidoreductase [Candidatus Omnitrophota bacterium]MDE2223397.1 FAD-dependent oxidoreductase [Candidatus Omnitrophota bacterium]
MGKKQIIIIGAGITGLTLAKELSAQYGASVVLIEKEHYVGGLAATLSRDGLTFDLGSHRIHPDYPFFIFDYLKGLDVELLRRPRFGTVQIQGKFIRYPANIFDFMRVMSLTHSFRLFSGYALNCLKRHPAAVNTYEEAMLKTVGREIYATFYMDFAKKLWGIDPSLIAVEGMKRRNVTVNLKTIKKALKGQNDYFFYPKHGMGDIAQKLKQAVLKNHAAVLEGCLLKKVVMDGKNRVAGVLVQGSDDQENLMEASVVVSTIPIDSLHQMVYGNDPAESLDWRGLLLVYLHIQEPLDRGNDTFYFPEMTTKLGRVSDNSKFSPYLNPSLKGVLLTVEIPASPGETLWEMSEAELAGLCAEELVKTGIYKARPTILRHFSVRLEKAYPLYSLGWERKLAAIYDHLKGVNGLYTLGRRGLFLHSNIDHAILQGIELSKIIMEGRHAEWDQKINTFREFTARD